MANINDTVYVSDETGILIDSKLAAIKPGGNTGQVLIKQSGDDYDSVWADTPSSSELLTFNPVALSEVVNLTLFVDSADNVLKFKDNTGDAHNVITSTSLFRFTDDGGVIFSDEGGITFQDLDT